MSKKPRVPPLHSYEIAYQNPMLETREKDEKGNFRTLYLTHPGGNRKMRRHKQRHHPYFTKSRHKGRDWHRAIIEMQERQEDGKTENL